ncbi:MAG TPA: ABC transporter permease, partial [Reyranella sp.]|nr:ABC transporter permease [Reyranella sp.]
MIAGYILRRLAFLPLTLLLVAFATFIVLRLTGNPVDIFLDINRTPEQVEALTKRLHLDQPLPVQFLIFLGDLLHGDFGESLQFTGSAAVVVWERVGATLQLAGTALALAVVLGVLGGL